ncbi:hypothetical protein G6F58_005773 [Rhizopus delemar]|nr:hypothetical protein G6F58_005773 [Rhizopus delemar]
MIGITIANCQLASVSTRFARIDIWIPFAFYVEALKTPTARLTYDSLALGSSTDIQVLSGLRVDGHTIIACTIWAIWRCHWRFVFDGRTFWPDEAAARATRAIKRIHEESSYREIQKSLRSD